MMQIFKHCRISMLSIAASTLALTAAVAPPAIAQDQTRQFDIPAQPLSSALTEFARQSGIVLVVPSELVQGKRAPEIRGAMAPDEALGMLLAGSGLQPQSRPDGGLTLTRTANAAPAQAEPDDFSSANDEIVVVTAQKREERLQDVPIAVQAIGGEELQRRDVASASEILNLYANLSLNGTNEINSGFTIRGIGTNNYHGNVSQAVGVYYDEVTQSTPFSAVLGVFDMDRVEVLRGPQNTLFGRNTTGGAINYISRKPEIGAGYNGYGRFTYGSFNRIDVEGALNVPLGDEAAMRVSLQSNQRDGPFNNLAAATTGAPAELGVRDRVSGRIQLAVEPENSSVELLVNLHGARNRGDSVGNKARGTRDPNDRTQLCPDLATSGDFGNPNSCVDINGVNPSTSDWLDLYNASSARSDVDIFGGFINANIELGWATLTSITSYDETDVQLADEIAGTTTLQFAPHQDSNYKDFSQDLRLISPGDSNLRWILGLFYFKQDLLQGTQVRRDNGGAAAPGGESVAFNIMDQTDEDISAYGQFEFDLSDRLTFTGGLRFTHNDKQATSLFGVALTPATVYQPGTTFMSRDFVLALTDGAPERCPPGPPGVDANGRPFGGPPPCLLPLLRPSQTLDRWGGRLALDYHFDDDFLVYASYSRGFKSGGFDTRALAAFAGGAGIPVGPEELDAYEMGFKSQPMRSLIFNGALFFYAQEGLQTFSVVNNIPGFFNIPESEVTGIELELNWSPDPLFRIQASAGYLDTEITDNGGLPGIDQGHPLPDSPEFTFNAIAEKGFDLGESTLWFQLDTRYVDEQVDSLRYFDDFVSTKDEQLYVDIRTALEFGSMQQYELAVFGENLTGVEYCADIGSVDDLSPSSDDLTSTVQCQPGTLGEPTWGISLRAAF